MENLNELLSFQWARDTGPVSLQEAGLRLVLAILLSAAVGIDRELKHKPLGLRTNMLVALGAASFSLMALQLVHELASGPTSIQIDPSRVMEAIVGAIGFLGAAAIIQGRFELFGATTGASIWVVGAIGMACGFGFYTVAVIITFIGLFVLTVLGFVTGRALRPRGTAGRGTGLAGAPGISGKVAGATGRALQMPVDKPRRPSGACGRCAGVQTRLTCKLSRDPRSTRLRRSATVPAQPRVANSI